MTRLHASCLLPLSLTVLSACAMEAGEPEPVLEDVDTAVSALEGPNALNPNALNPNALNPNALNPNSLSATPLQPSALQLDADMAIKNSGAAGEISREFLRYAVGCALSPSQSFSFTWTDANNVAHDETYWGILGLATSWATKPLAPSGQLWVSACLASRTNWYGITVMISSRGLHSALNKSGTNELTAYTHGEGAFWGNLFAVITPTLKACHGSEPAYARSKARDCAAGHLNADGTVSTCGMIEIVGDCASVCQSFSSTGHYWSGCGVDHAAISVFLE